MTLVVSKQSCNGQRWVWTKEINIFVRVTTRAKCNYIWYKEAYLFTKLIFFT